jgi:hypothetical protein
MRRLLLGALCAALILVLILISPSAHAATGGLHRYQTGKAVRGLTWLLGGHRPSVYRIQAWRHPVTNVYDKRVAAAVRNMKWRIGYPHQSLNGNVAGATFIAYLKGKHRPISYRVTAGNRIVALQKQRYNLAHPPTSAKVALLIKDAQYLISVRSAIGYSQTTRMQIVRLRLRVPPLSRFIYEDCSSSVTGLYWLAGLPDPNNRGYDGYGYTGTQANHGQVVWHLGQPLSLLRPGDLVFYGGGFPHHHVTMYLGNGRVFSHGSSTGPLNLPVLYRGDAVGAHRYVTG